MHDSNRWIDAMQCCHFPRSDVPITCTDEVIKIIHQLLSWHSIIISFEVVRYAEMLETPGVLEVDEWMGHAVKVSIRTEIQYALSQASLSPVAVSQDFLSGQA
jgi:hypothetical protein